jgi:hypothetical protein
VTATQPERVRQPRTGTSGLTDRHHATRQWLVDHNPVEFVLGVEPPRPSGSWRIDSAFVEQFWLPLLGPTALVLQRHLFLRLADDQPEVIDLYDLADEIGCPAANLTPDCTVVRTLARLIGWDFIDQHAAHVVVRPVAPRMRPGLVAKLPARLQVLLESQ